MAQIKNRDLFENMPIGRAVRTMAVPTIMGQLIVLIYSMADTFFIGRTNNPTMVAAASLILPVFNITISIASIAGVGGGSLVSRLLGEKKEEEAKKVYSFCIYLSVLCALFFSLIVFVFMKPILNVLGADSETYDFARRYAMCVIVVGSLPTIMTNVFSNMVRSIGESSRAGFGVTMGGIINILLDPLFMFVILPPGMEVMGAGIATCLSNCISCIYFIIVIRKVGRESVLCMLWPTKMLLGLKDDAEQENAGIRESFWPSKSSISQIFAVGVPSSVATFLFDMDYVVLDKLMSSYGNISLAAIGIVLKVERLPLNVGVGICQGMVPIVAYNYASGNYKRMKALTNYFMRLGIIIALGSIAMYELLAPFIMRIFIADAGTVELGTTFLRARCLATILMFISFFHVHLFNSYGRGKEALFLGVMRWAVFNIPMLFIMNAIFGMYGLVWSQLCADILTVTLSLWVHRRFLKKSGLLEKMEEV